MFREDHVGCSVDDRAISVFFLHAVVQPSFLLRVVYKSVWEDNF